VLTGQVSFLAGLIHSPLEHLKGKSFWQPFSSGHDSTLG
jgi:hypothetical protein